MRSRLGAGRTLRGIPKRERTNPDLAYPGWEGSCADRMPSGALSTVSCSGTLSLQREIRLGGRFDALRWGDALQAEVLTRRGLRLVVCLLVFVPRWVQSADEPIAWPQRRLPVDARQGWPYRPLLRESQRQDHSRSTRSMHSSRRMLSSPGHTGQQRTRLRRVTFDLIGLPPSQQDVAEWETSDDPWMYERIVDQLLANPHYGERWAPLWLDLVRFAESHGFETRSFRPPTAYHYRDAIIAAANGRLPFREFIRQQIPGDKTARTIHRHGC